MKNDLFCYGNLSIYKVNGIIWWIPLWLQPCFHISRASLEQSASLSHVPFHWVTLKKIWALDWKESLLYRNRVSVPDCKLLLPVLSPVRWVCLLRLELLLWASRYQQQRRQPRIDSAPPPILIYDFPAEINFSVNTINNKKQLVGCIAVKI